MVAKFDLESGLTHSLRNHLFALRSLDPDWHYPLNSPASFFTSSPKGAALSGGDAASVTSGTTSFKDVMMECMISGPH